MNKIQKFDQWVLSIAFAILIIASVIFLVRDTFYKTSPAPITSSWHDTMCLHDVIPVTGGTISEISPGSYAYTLIARSDGMIEVWKECDASGGTQ